MTTSCTGEIGLCKPGEHTSGPNLVSRDNVPHIEILTDSRIVGTLERPVYVSAHVLWGRFSD
jgi:hypothetical protein